MKLRRISSPGSITLSDNQVTTPGIRFGSGISLSIIVLETSPGGPGLIIF
jgi:hypothetical protein